MSQDTPIAIVGLSYRAPGIGRKGLWDYLAQARSAWTKIPSDRFQHEAYYKPEPDKSGTLKSEGAHFLPGGIYGFDATFFNMRAEEARNSDPQHRMLLETALEAAEDAGYSLLDLAGKNIGAYIAFGSMEYANRLFGDVFAASTFSATGVAPCMFANRLSYFFDIHGPSVAIEAACASSAYATDQAVKGLRNGDCDAAFVGASALFMAPNSWISLEKTGALSAFGRSYSYDHKAAGFGRGEGGACLFIKRLDDAIRDGDPIHAVIRNSACNHGGRSEGITMPRRMAHEMLLRKVHDGVNLSPAETPVVEGHGTGTAAGDPIEAGAFASVLGKERTEKNPLYIGSIKSNFGHLEGASGILGMIKAIYMLKNGVILPTAGFESINPRIEGKEKIVVAQLPIPWPKTERKRVLVTNFGFGGSNSAVLLEEAPAAATNGTNGTNGHANGNGVSTPEVTVNRIYAFSAKTEKSLTAYLKSFGEFLDEVPETRTFIKDLSYTLGQRRTHYPYRAAIAADSLDDLREKLVTAKPTRSRDRNVVFAFTGQGAQYAQMATGLGHYKVFAAALEEIEEELKALGSSWSLIEELSKPAEESRVNEAEISQPACTAVQLALVKLLSSWDITADAVTGHSSGEIAAAYAAGLLSFKTAIALAYFRGQAVAKQTRKGAMLALGIGYEEATKLIAEHAGSYATVAASNSPQSSTISGDESAIQNIHKAADKDEIFARRLKIQVAYHSAHMQDVAEYYYNEIKPIYDQNKTAAGTGAGAYPRFVSSVTGKEENSSSVDASYWVKNLVQRVQFSTAITSLFSGQTETNAFSKDLPNLLVEVGPHSALKGPINQTVDIVRQNNSRAKATFKYVPTLVRGTEASEAILSLASDLFTSGVPIQLGGVNQTNVNNAKVLTELPPYEWDKSVLYETQSRLVKEILYPGDSYHELLGRRAPTSGSNDRSYRQVFTLDEFPWIRDHNVAGAVIFPMTGYLSCIIEAARRTATTTVASFVVRDFHAVRSLEIQEDTNVDIVTKLKPVSTGPGTVSTTAWTFDLSSWASESGWTIHCYGRIEIETSEMTLESPIIKESLPLITSPDLIEHDVDYAYSTAGVRGTRYGPTFRNTYRFLEGKGFTVIEQKLRDLGGTQPGAYGSPVTVDPPTLDGFLQGGGSLQEHDGKRRAQMPNHISRFRISNNMPSSPNQVFTTVTRRLNYDVKGGRMHISVASFAQDLDGTYTPVAEWESVAFRSLASAVDDDPATEVPENWAWELVPRYDFLAPETLAESLSVKDLDQSHLLRGRKLNHVSCYYIDKALKEIANDDTSKLSSNLSRFIKWAGRAVAREGVDLTAKPTALLEDVKNMDAQGELLCAIGESLVPILREEVQPLEIMLKDGLLTRHYEADTANEHFSKIIGDLVSNLSDLEPNLRILEIGAGTAGTTLHVLNAISNEIPDGAFLNYTFTDISAGFFENAREKLAKWSKKIIYKKLDISQDPTKQGVNLGEYDIVIAANVLHATADMTETMTNVRSLLRPKGKILLLEANRHPPPTLPFALLPGWWYAKDHYRDHDEGPLLSAEGWNRLLIDTGFSGVDVALQDHPGSPEQMVSVLSSTRIGKCEETSEIVITGPFMDEEEIEFAQTVADSIADSTGAATSIKPFAEIDSSEEPFYIIIDSPRHTIFDNVTEEVFDLIKTVLLRTKGIAWVTPENGAPEAKFIRGLLHTLRLEDSTKHLLLFEDVPSTSRSIPAIIKLANIIQDPEIFASEDQDFNWYKGAIHLPRMRQMREVKEKFAVEQNVALRTVQNLWQKDSALELTIEAAGSPDSLYFRRSKVLQQTLDDDELLVEVEAAGLGQRDLNVVFGTIPWAPPGYEGAGKVIKTGSKVSHLQPGDSVFYLSLEQSAISTYVKLPSAHAARIPAGMSIFDATSLPLAYSIAILSLIHIGRLRKNETVLIHSAAGSVGQACVVIAQHLGAEIFVTAGTKSKREFLHNTFNIPTDHIFSSRTSHFGDGIQCATAGKGVDVIVNSLGGDLLQESWGLTAKFGRFIEIGKRDAFQNSNLPMKPFDSSVTFSGVDLRELAKYRPEELKEVFAETVSLIQQNVLQPIKPVTVLPVSLLTDGLRKLRSGDNIGKIVVSLGKDEQVLAETALEPTKLELKGDATYVITGGTRGIGLSVAYWLIGHGAKNIVALGRSGSTGAEIQELLQKYDGTDVTVRAYACDIGVRSDLLKVVGSIKDLPPVRGVIHGALVLSDKLLENATYEDYKIVTGPRIAGAWNLSDLLPDLDFFILLSSFLGDTGNIGQAIYGGTASFYEAFANYRNARGQNTVSIALPVVLDVGYVASNEITDRLKATLGATLRMSDIFVFIKSAILGLQEPFFTNNKGTAFKMALNGQSVESLPWKYFHPVLIKGRLQSYGDESTAKSGSGADASESWTVASNPLIGLTEALITKVSAMTMIERSEIEADAPLADHGLDSLVSVELRNWIRRETTVELALTTITQAASLHALASHVLMQLGTIQKV